jgi:ketosteroid isomerase-like protein
MKRGLPFTGRPDRTAVQAVSFALLATLGMALTGCRIERTTTPGQQDPAADVASHVEEILQLSAAAWNAGDLDGFMVHYERAPTTTYIGSGGLLIGFDAIHDRYAPEFEPEAERDSLRFESIRARPLDQLSALATARYVLHRDGETTSTGPFTLVLRRIEGDWKIIHDQSAADPPPEPPPDEDEPPPGEDEPRD